MSKDSLYHRFVVAVLIEWLCQFSIGFLIHWLEEVKLSTMILGLGCSMQLCHIYNFSIFYKSVFTIFSLNSITACQNSQGFGNNLMAFASSRVVVAEVRWAAFHKASRASFKKPRQTHPTSCLSALRKRMDPVVNPGLAVFGLTWEYLGVVMRHLSPGGKLAACLEHSGILDSYFVL